VVKKVKIGCLEDLIYSQNRTFFLIMDNFLKWKYTNLIKYPKNQVSNFRLAFSIYLNIKLITVMKSIVEKLRGFVRREWFLLIVLLTITVIIILFEAF
jgi:hypothetical protein